MPRRLQRWLGALCLILGVTCPPAVILYAAAAAAPSPQPEQPAKLWSEYPLDPARASEPGSTPARRTSPSASTTSQQQPSTPVRAPEPADDASFPSLRLGILAGFGLAVLLAAGSALSVLVPSRGNRKKRRTPVAAKPKRAAKKPKRPALLRRERPVRAPSQQASNSRAAATQRALPVSAAEIAPAPASSPTPAEPREPQANGRAEVVPARQETVAARQPEPLRANGSRPNGAGPPATTWFTEPHESCEIALWRGYMRAQFYARPAFPEPGDYALEVSPKFRLRGETPKAHGSALAAYERLIEQLVRRGWEPSGLGGQWFEQWFRRRLPAGQGLAPVGSAPPAQMSSGRS